MPQNGGTMSMKERHFVCPECGNKELVLVRDERVACSLYQSQRGDTLCWEYGKERLIDSTMTEMQCGNGHPLKLKNGMIVQDDLKALEEWFEQRGQESRPC
jgi:hypothetical protein